MIPTSLRPLPKPGELLDLTNLFLPVMINFPIPPKDFTPVQRVDFYKKIFDKYKSSMDVFLLNKLVDFNKFLLPDYFNFRLNKFILDKITFIFSSIPGPLDYVKLKNEKDRDLTKILGFANGLARIGLFFIFFSYGDKITCCACSDAAINF